MSNYQHDHEHSDSEHSCRKNHFSAHRDHGHGHQGHHHRVDRSTSRRVLWSSLFILAGFLVIESIGGVITNSLALISDAGHLLTDVAAIALALLAQWFATHPSTAKRSFGFRRFEIMAALINGLTLWLIAVFIGIEAIERVLSPPEVQTGLMIAVAAAGAVAQLIAAMILLKGSGESLNVKGAYIHAVTDAVQSVGVVIAGIFIHFTGWSVADPIISIIIAVLIFWSGGKIVFEATHVLIEGTPEGIDLEAVAQAMVKHDGVEKITDLHAWSITSGYNALSSHVIVNDEMDAEQRESILHDLTRMLCGEFALHHVTLQVECRCVMCDENDCSQWLESP